VTKTHISMNDLSQIEKDIWDWITGYIETPHSFYDHKFPPCPYAKAARLKKLVDVQVYSSGSCFDFVTKATENIISNATINTRILVFPYYVRWFYFVKWSIKKLNKKVIPKDYYLQYGRAIKTQSKFKGLFVNKPYFIVIINKVSDVVAGHQALINTDYYRNWTPGHYHDVVVRRQKMFDRYKGN